MQPLINPLSALTPQQIVQTLRDGRSLLEVNPLPATPPDVQPGERVDAQVLENLSDNRLLVQIKNQLLTLNPVLGKKNLNAEPGATLKLQAVNTGASLTFRLLSDVESEAIDTALSRVTLSGPSRYLGALLEQATPEGEENTQDLNPFTSSPLLPDLAEEAGLNSANTVRAPFTESTLNAAMRELLKTPLLTPDTLPALNSRELASALKQLLSTSGSFYESHLAQWVNGQRSLAQVVSEPQARLELPKALLTLLNASSQSEEEAAQATPSRSGSEVRDPNSSNVQLGNLLERQLNTLETRQTTVQGQAWPGQPFELTVAQSEVDEREAREQEEGEASVPWLSQLTLSLPHLGEVTIRIALSGKSVQLRFDAAKTDTAAQIAGEQTRLLDAMSNAGLNVIQYAVNRDG